MAAKNSIVYRYHIFLIHSSVVGHLGCFHNLAIVNSAALFNGTGEKRRTGSAWKGERVRVGAGGRNDRNDVCVCESMNNN
jgi:hypothetical protein